jgi:hypothetical protein
MEAKSSQRGERKGTIPRIMQQAAKVPETARGQKAGRCLDGSSPGAKKDFRTRR